MPPVRKPKLADLSAEDRAALRAELDAEKTETQTAEAAARDRQWLKRMHPRDHLRDCPHGEEDPGDAPLRIEAYPHIKPARPDAGEPAVPVTVVRCITCGGTNVIKQPFEQVAAEVAEATDEALAAA